MVDSSLVYFAKMHGNLHAAYSAAKAFSGPIATVIAAAVAARVTARFASLQHETARQQAATAEDQLRSDLFDKRYRVYDQVSELLRLLINAPGGKLLGIHDLGPFRSAIYEARFLFSDPVCDWLRVLWEQDMPQFLEARIEFSDPRFSPTTQKLMARLQELQGVFEQDMRFSMLTGDGAKPRMMGQA